MADDRMRDESQIPESERVGHETTDAEVGLVVKFAIFLTVVSLIVAVLMVGFHKYLDAREQAAKAPRHPMAAGQVRPLPPPPRLQSSPFTDLTEFRQEENRLLNRYGWVDRNAGIVRIPVERAIEVLAERGLPHRTAAETTEQTAPGTATGGTTPGIPTVEQKAPDAATGEAAPDTTTDEPEPAPTPAPAPDDAAAPVPR